MAVTVVLRSGQKLIYRSATEYNISNKPVYVALFEDEGRKPVAIFREEDLSSVEDDWLEWEFSEPENRDAIYQVGQG